MEFPSETHTITDPKIKFWPCYT